MHDFDAPATPPLDIERLWFSDFVLFDKDQLWEISREALRQVIHEEKCVDMTCPHCGEDTVAKKLIEGKNRVVCNNGHEWFIEISLERDIYGYHHMVWTRPSRRPGWMIRGITPVR